MNTQDAIALASQVKEQGGAEDRNEFKRALVALLDLVNDQQADKALLDEFEAVCRCDDVQGRQISEDECEQELLGHYWGTPSVQSTSVRVAIQTAIDATKPNSP